MGDGFHAVLLFSANDRSKNCELSCINCHY
jgi:hypothetical protein